jgi:hypothetical protein
MKIHNAVRLMLIAGAMATQTASAGPPGLTPVEIVAGERCHRCHRVIANRHVAAETIAEDGSAVHKFRTIRCMLAYLNQALPTSNRVFVADYETAELMDVEQAAFVAVSFDVNTCETGDGHGEIDFAAFRSPEAAERFAIARGVTTMSWVAVVYEAASIPAPHVDAY